MKINIFRKTVVIGFMVVLVLILSITALAHPGKTDSSGGHTDHSTGEYHYHHSHPAHSHYDMDGDGIVDCPYDFAVQQSSRNEKNSSNSERSSSYTSPPSQQSASYESALPVDKMEDIEVPNWIYWIISFLVIVIIILCFVIYNQVLNLRYQDRQIVSLKEKFEKDIAKERSFFKNGLSSLHAALCNYFGKNYLYKISNAADGDFVGSDMLPHSQGFSTDITHDQYTFFLGGKASSKYHLHSCKYAKLDYPINAYQIDKCKQYQPCSICISSLPDTKWADEYFLYKSFLGKYISVSEAQHTE